MLNLPNEFFGPIIPLFINSFSLSTSEINKFFHRVREDFRLYNIHTITPPLLLLLLFPLVLLFLHLLLL
jgi:hypothetical protein